MQSAYRLSSVLGLAAILGAMTDAYAVVVTTPPCDRFTGGGYLFGTPTGARANFGVGGGFLNGNLWGHLNYVDHATTPGMHVKGVDVTSYSATGPTSRQTTGTCTIDGVPGTYVLEVADNGEPGTSDTFSLTLSTGYHASGVIAGGNIQLHKSNCGDDDGTSHMDDFVDE